MRSGGGGEGGCGGSRGEGTTTRVGFSSRCMSRAFVSLLAVWVVFVLPLCGEGVRGEDEEEWCWGGLAPEGQPRHANASFWSNTSGSGLGGGPSGTTTAMGRVTLGGDLNGDGVPDLVFTAPLESSPVNSAGAVYIVFGVRGQVWSGPYNVTTNVSNSSSSASNYSSSPSPPPPPPTPSGGFPQSVLLNSSFVDGLNGFMVVGSTPFDLLGTSVDLSGHDLNGDGLDDLVIGSPNSDPGAKSNAGSAYVIFGSPGPWQPLFDVGTLDGTNGFVANGNTAGQRCGEIVALTPDINGDGMDDLMVSAPYADAGADSYNAGSVFIVFGRSSNTSWSAALTLATECNIRLDGGIAGELFGCAVAGADLNGDGIADMVVGARQADFKGSSSSGVVYVLWGQNGTFPAYFSMLFLTPAMGSALGGEELSGAGWAVANVGDIDLDGYVDVAIGAPGVTTVSSPSVYVVYGANTSLPGTLFLPDHVKSGGAVRVWSNDTASGWGRSLSGAGDVNGDGVPDLVVGAPGSGGGGGGGGQPPTSLNDTETGSVSLPYATVLYGRGGGGRWQPETTVEEVVDGVGFTATSLCAVSLLGSIVSGPGDVDGDGYADLLLGAPGTPADNTSVAAGAVFVVLGQPSPPYPNNDGTSSLTSSSEMPTSQESESSSSALFPDTSGSMPSFLRPQTMTWSLWVLSVLASLCVFL